MTEEHGAYRTRCKGAPSIFDSSDEEAGIARTVSNLLALDYPREAFRVLVVADNCADGMYKATQVPENFLASRRSLNASLYI